MPTRYTRLGFAETVSYIDRAMVSAGVKVTVKEGQIVVTDHVTDWRAAYRRSPALKTIIASEIVTDRKSAVSDRSKFLAEAFRKASERARKLGWMT